MIEPPKCLLKPLVVPQRLLMGPGPGNVSPRVRAAGAMPLIGHMHPEMFEIMNDIKEGIQYIFQTRNKMTLAISGTGHAGKECACTNLIEPGDVVVVGVNGYWGHVFSEIAERHGAVVKKMERPLGQVFTLSDIEKALKEHRPVLTFLTQGESTGGTLQPLEGVGDLCHRYNSLLVIDTVAALGGCPLYMDKWGIDMIYTGSQKSLSCPPGTSPISLSPAAWRKVQNRKSKVRSYYLDLNLLANYWGCDEGPRRYHHTGPITSLYQLREGIAILAEEGLENSWKRHKECQQILHKGLHDMGLTLFVKDPAARLPNVTTINLLSGVKWNAVTGYMMKNYGLEITGGLGPSIGKVWRIGLMGNNATEQNVRTTLRVMKEAIEWAKANPQAKL